MATSTQAPSNVSPGNNNHNHTNGNVILHAASAVLTSMSTLPRSPHRNVPEPNNQERPYRVTETTRYLECVKNHASHLGKEIHDGCREFMPGGEDGSIEALQCHACTCHRNFHIKVEIPVQPAVPVQPVLCTHCSHLMLCPNCSRMGPIAAPIPERQVAGNRSEEGGVSKKRHRTKFTQAQKEKMLWFSEKSDWKIQKLDEAELRRFCNEINVTRNVLKVWMHNNKYHQGNKKKTIVVSAAT